MRDRIETFRRSRIQHGPLNRRIYVMKLHRNDVPGILADLDGLARDRDYEKILVKVPASLKDFFEKNGYVQEAFIPGFFMGKEDLAFMSKFTSKDRMIDDCDKTYRSMMSAVRQKAENLDNTFTLACQTVMRCGRLDADEISGVYRQVFESYPFPIYDSDFLRLTMDSHVNYYAIRHQGQMVAVAASEKDREDLNVEMTDFATLPAFRGLGLACCLLAAMEADMAATSFIVILWLYRDRTNDVISMFDSLSSTTSLIICLISSGSSLFPSSLLLM